MYLYFYVFIELLGKTIEHTCSILNPYVPISENTHLADSSLQHCIQSSLRCVHVS